MYQTTFELGQWTGVHNMVHGLGEWGVSISAVWQPPLLHIGFAWTMATLTNTTDIQPVVMLLPLECNIIYHTTCQLKSIPALEQKGGNMLAAIVTVRKDNHARVFPAAIPMLTSCRFSHKWIFSWSTDALYRCCWCSHINTNETGQRGEWRTNARPFLYATDVASTMDVYICSTVKDTCLQTVSEAILVQLQETNLIIPKKCHIYIFGGYQDSQMHPS